MIEKIISGGQTGADIAGLKFVRDNGIPTGGSAPKDFMTEAGSKPELRDLYNLRELNGSYEDRTIQNVMDADGTVIFAEKMTDGSRLTLDTCIKEKKPHLLNPTTEEFLTWISDNGIRVLNIAGNRESVAPGIEQRVYNFLHKALGHIGD
jgi:hypothetical protein